MGKFNVTGAGGELNEANDDSVTRKGCMEGLTTDSDRKNRSVKGEIDISETNLQRVS